MRICDQCGSGFASLYPFIIDGGANVGMASLYFLNRYPTARVIAVEPDDANLELCRMNLAPYGNRVTLIHGAIWKCGGRLALEAGRQEWVSRVRDDQAGSVEAFTLASLIAHGDGKVGLLKLDIEGSEIEVFGPNAREWLPSVRNIAIELHGEDRKDGFFAALKRYRYDLSLHRTWTDSADESMPCYLAICQNLHPESAGLGAPGRGEIPDSWERPCYPDDLKIASRAPLLFRLTNRLVRAGIRGSSRLMDMLAARGVLDVVVEYPFGRFAFGVPLWRVPMELEDLLEYESALINLFCSRISPMRDGVLFDCGADIGIFSSVICARSEAISSVMAFEPNADAPPVSRRRIWQLFLSPLRRSGARWRTSWEVENWNLLVMIGNTRPVFWCRETAPSASRPLILSGNLGAASQSR